MLGVTDIQTKYLRKESLWTQGQKVSLFLFRPVSLNIFVVVWYFQFLGDNHNQYHLIHVWNETGSDEAGYWQVHFLRYINTV